MLQPSINLRWATLGLDLGVGGGTAPISNSTNLPVNVVGTKAGVTWERAGFRAGGRIPLNVVALNLGISTGYDGVSFANVPSGYTPPDSGHGYLGSWASLDIQVLCDWAVFGGVEVDGYLKKFIDFDSSSLSPIIGVALQPNRICRRERDTTYGLTTAAAGK